MKNIFSNWLKNKNEGPLANFGHVFNDMEPYDYDDTRKDLMDVLFNRYQTEFLDFVDSLANGRNDNELSTIMSRIHKSPKNNMKPKHFHEPDDVVMPMADKGGGSSFEDE